MDSDWLEFHPDPKKPDFRLPYGAVDAHCHVFGPSSQFPFAAERKYTPCDAGKKQLYALRDHLGFSRNVIVQATCHGKDNRAMVDACRSSGGLARGIASVGVDVTEEEIADLKAELEAKMDADREAGTEERKQPPSPGRSLRESRV